MKAYRFITRVTNTGTIQIPYNPTLYDKEVEIIILPKQRTERGKMKATEFVDKWAGFLVDNETDKSKFDYLSEKYK